MKDTYCPKCRTQLLLTKEVEKSERIRCTECKATFFNPYHKDPKTVKSKSTYKRPSKSYKKKSRNQQYNKISTIQWVIGVISILFIIGLLMPDDEKYNYTLTEYDVIHYEKYSANIRIERELTRQELRKLANYIYRKENLNKYKRAFLVYYLPNMKFGQGGWATTHFNPNLEIIISE